MFVNPETGEFFRYGERIKPKEFCETLKMIAMLGGDLLYNGSLSKIFVSDIKRMGGIITEQDMANYRYMVTN
jgi:gamma-glutamyltranspeptidase/glutathione hydrolase/leukotriene-C4 hydrolase